MSTLEGLDQGQITGLEDYVEAAGRRQDARGHRQRRSPGRRGTCASPRCAARRVPRLDALAQREPEAPRAVRVRRGVRLHAPSPSEPADQAPAGCADEASPRLRCRRGARDAEPDGPRLPRPRQRGHLVHRPPANRRRPRTRHRRASGKRRRARTSARGRRTKARAALVRDARRACGAEAVPGAAPLGVLVATGSHDAQS